MVAMTGDAKRSDGLNWEIGKRAVVDGRLYGKQLEIARGYCDEAASALNARRGDPAKYVSSDSALANTVVGVVGERGSGKTSFLHTLRQKLPENYYKLEVVDPSNFESNMSALELFLARLFQEYAAIRSQRHPASGMYESPRLHTLFREISSRLSEFRIDEGVYRSDNPSMEVLAHMVGLVEIGATLQDLCDEFLGYVNAVPSGQRKDCLVMFIDDVDMIENKKVYRLLEDVRKFLSGRIVVVIAYRDKQLMSSIFNQKIRENKRLLKRGLIGNRELQLQIEDFIEKVIPIDRTVRLMSQSDILEKPILETLASLVDRDAESNALYVALVEPYVDACGLGESPSVREWLDAVLYSKALLRIAPVNEQEETAFVWPRNLRELISLAKVLHCDLESVEPGVFDAGKCRTYRLNLGRYRDYYLSRLGEAIDPSLYDVVDKWLRSRCEAKNYVAYAAVSQLLLSRFAGAPKTDDDDPLALGDLLDSSVLRPDNVTIGDISALLRRFERVCHTDEGCIHLGYSFKMLYSMECLGYLLEALEDAFSISADTEDVAVLHDSEALDSYLTLINSCVIPPEVSASELSYALIYPCWTPEWQEALMMKPTRFAEPSAETIKRVMLLFAGSNVIASRPRSLPSDTVVDSSRPLRRRFARANRYSEAQNRPFFTLADVDPLGDSSYGFRASSPDRIFRYYFNPMNVLGRRWYVERSLQDFARNRASAYFFYSMFDLDVVNGMQLNPKGPRQDMLKYQMRRINAAVIAPRKSILELRGDVVDDEDAAEDADPFIMNIALPYEAKMQTRMHAPFVLNVGYRLFGGASSVKHSDDGSSEWSAGTTESLLSFRDIDAVYRMAHELEYEARNSERFRLSSGLLNCLRTGGKNDFCNFADEFSHVLDQRHMTEAAERALVIVGRLRQPNMRPRQEERSELEELAREWPVYANEAFSRGRDE